MTLTLTSLLNSSVGTATSANTGTTQSGTTQSGSTTATAAVKAAASPLGAIQKRVQADADSTQTQLSAFGVLKSAVAQSQIAAQAAGKLGTTATANDLTKAMGDLFNAYNGTIAASATATRAVSASANESANAARVGKDYQRTLTAPGASEALKKLGLSVKADGTLVQDAKKFAEAVKADPSGVRAALGKLAAGMNSAASKELDASGAVGGTLSRLNQRSTALTAQQKALSSAAQGLAAYQANS